MWAVILRAIDQADDCLGKATELAHEVGWARTGDFVKIGDQMGLIVISGIETNFGPG